MSAPLSWIAVFGFVGFTTIMGCESIPPESPASENLNWKTFSHLELPFTVEYPDVYRPETDDNGEGMRFRYRGFPVVSVSCMTRERADDRGLWAGHPPAGDITLAGIPGKKYIYNHFDGPMYMRTVSYVIPRGERYLALEFRTRREALDTVQTRMLESLELE